MMDKPRVAAVLGLLALVIGAMGAGASARPFADSEIIAFNGAMTVVAGNVKPGAANTGLFFAISPGGCPQDTSAAGLIFKCNRVGSWQLVSTVCAALGFNGPVIHPACVFGANGLLAPVDGIGAACDYSHGHGGTGTYDPDGAGPLAYALNNVGWIVSAGFVLPLHGTYVFSTGPAKKAASKRVGPFFGLLLMQGGIPCIKPPQAPKGPGGGTVTTPFAVRGIIRMH